jgi:hypothetical protein
MPNFRDLAFAGIAIGLFSCYTIVINHSAMRLATVIGKFLAFSALLNMEWILPIVLNLRYWIASINSVPVPQVTQLSANLTSIFRGIGKWGFDSGYNGLLYHPYSVVYSSIPFIFLGYIITLFAFSSLLGSRSKQTLFMAFFTLLFIFLSKGGQPPLGVIYSDSVLFGPLRVFRESFYFMQLLALGYAYLLGEFVSKGWFRKRVPDASVSKVRYRSFPRIPLNAKKLLPMILIGIIVVYSWPLYTGAVAENWYRPGTNGVSFPHSYQELSTWLASKNNPSRLLFLPALGDYVAFQWGYQGGSDIFDGLFSEPVIVGSSWSEYAYPTRSQVNQIYQAVQSNDTSTFKSLAYLFSIRDVLIDESRDLAFYGGPSVQSYENFILRAGFQISARFDFLRIYENLDALPLTYVTTNVIPQVSSIDRPSGIMWSLTDFAAGWTQAPSRLDSNATATYAQFQVNGSYTTFTFTINQSVKSNPNYLLIAFATNQETSVAVAANTTRLEYLFALNPPVLTSLNHYQSLSPYVLAFSLPPETINSIEIFVTNHFAPSFVGNLQVWLRSVSVANDIGLPYDILQQTASPNSPAVTVSTEDNRSYLSSVNGRAVFLPSEVIPGKDYRLSYTASGPSVLVLNEAFDPSWIARVNGVQISTHFEANGFSNGWVIPAGTSMTVVITFGLQGYFLLGSLIAIASFASLACMILVRRVIRNKKSKKQALG